MRTRGGGLVILNMYSRRWLLGGVCAVRLEPLSDVGRERGNGVGSTTARLSYELVLFSLVSLLRQLLPVRSTVVAVVLRAGEGSTG
jgi:hypothetical protein